MNLTDTSPSTNGPTGRRHQLRRSLGVAVLAAGLISIAACSTNSATNAASTNAPTPNELHVHCELDLLLAADCTLIDERRLDLEHGNAARPIDIQRTSCNDDHAYVHQHHHRRRCDDTTADSDHRRARRRRRCTPPCPLRRQRRHNRAVDLRVRGRRRELGQGRTRPRRSRPRLFLRPARHRHQRPGRVDADVHHASGRN